MWTIEVAFCASLVAAVHGGARAETQPFSLDSADCPDELAHLRALVDIELGTVAAERVPRPVRIRLACEGEVVRIAVTDVASGRVNQSEISPHEPTSAARARLLALTITELVASAWNGPRPESSPKALPAREPEHSPTEVATPPPSRPAWNLFVDGGLRRAGAPSAWFVGGALGGAYAPVSHLNLVAELRAETGTVATVLDDVDASAWGADVMARVRLFLGRARVEAGPALRAMRVHLAPRSMTTDVRTETFDGWAAGPFLSTRLTFPVLWRVAVAARFDAGYDTHKTIGLANDQTQLVDTGGWWIGFGLGANLEFGAR